VARHAEAGRLWVELEGAGDRVDLSIRDDGVGFQPPSTTALVRDGRFGLVACGSGSRWPAAASSSTPTPAGV
jgi:two-component system NarL family sensor kinase